MCNNWCGNSTVFIQLDLHHCASDLTVTVITDRPFNECFPNDSYFFIFIIISFQTSKLYSFVCEFKIGPFCFLLIFSTVRRSYRSPILHYTSVRFLLKIFNYFVRWIIFWMFVHSILFVNTFPACNFKGNCIRCIMYSYHRTNCFSSTFHSCLSRILRKLCKKEYNVIAGNIHMSHFCNLYTLF